MVKIKIFFGLFEKSFAYFTVNYFSTVFIRTVFTQNTLFSTYILYITQKENQVSNFLLNENFQSQYLGSFQYSFLIHRLDLVTNNIRIISK